MNSKNPIKDPTTWMETTIKTFINNSAENTLKNKENDKAWGEPLVGFSRGDDPLYQEFKTQIGSFVWTPAEIFTKTFPHIKVKPDALTVISWILPHMEKTKSDNRKQTVYPAERWVRGRMFGEEVNEKLRSHVVATMQEAGYEACAPMLSPFFERKTSERYGFASTWSERHAAYASGLGTFGLCDGLITPKGKAMRCGSVVARIRIPPSSRPYTDHRAYCLFFAKAICGECIPRCPVGAITEAGHNKEKCGDYIRSKVVSYAKSHFNLEGQAYGCGLCQTDVACESKIPSEYDVT